VRGLAPATCVLLVLWVGLAGCDRNIEPFDPEEEPRQPDLSKIFPEGAERAEPAPPLLPPAPGEGRGASPLPAELAEADASRAGGAQPVPANEPGSITGRVEVAPELAGETPAGAVLFIIARRVAGGPPLAVKRVPDPVFPLGFRLGPSDRMIQQMPFEGPLTLSARLDGDGNATSRSEGDLQGQAEGEHQPGAVGVVIRLAERL